MDGRIRLVVVGVVIGVGVVGVGVVGGVGVTVIGTSEQGNDLPV